MHFWRLQELKYAQRKNKTFCTTFMLQKLQEQRNCRLGRRVKKDVYDATVSRAELLFPGRSNCAH